MHQPHKWGVYVQSRATFAQSHQRRSSRWLHNRRVLRHGSAIGAGGSIGAISGRPRICRYDTDALTMRGVAVAFSHLHQKYCLGLPPTAGLDATQAVSSDRRRECFAVRGHLDENASPCHVHVGKGTHFRQLWLAVSDESASLQTFREYSERFQIEEELLDEKSNGFQLERSEIRSVPALSRLCLVLAVSTLLLSVQGQHVVSSGKRRWVDMHWKRGKSYFRIGWNWLKGRLHKDSPLFPSIELQSRRNLAPAIAFKKQAQQLPKREFTVHSHRFVS